MPTTWVSPLSVQHRLRHPEVGHHQLGARPVRGAQQQVLRLDVAVDDPVAVQHREPGPGLPDQVERLVDRQIGRPSRDQVGDGAAVGVRHHEVRRALGLADVVDPDDVVGVGPAQDPRLLEEPLADVQALRPVVGQRLHRDVGLELVVVVEPHRGEPADPEALHPRAADRAVAGRDTLGSVPDQTGELGGASA